MTTEAAPDTAATALAVTELLYSARTGVLATLSAQHGGHPHASLAPYAVARDGALVLVMSELAEHTRNVRADPRASLFAQAPGDHPNPQSVPRVCAMGTVSELAGDARDDARARYLARFPEAGFYLGKLDFRVYALAVERVHLVAGFGKITWLAGDALRALHADDPLASGAEGICAHMNDDHPDALAIYCEAFRNHKTTSARMTSIDAFGFDVVDTASSQRFRFDFPTRATSSDEVRMHMVSLVREGRAKLAPRG